MKKTNYIDDPNRKPIILNNTTFALISLYEDKAFDFLDMALSMDAEEETPSDYGKIMEASAKEFVRQLKEQWCVYFMLALKKEIQKELDAHDKSTRSNG